MGPRVLKVEGAEPILTTVLGGTRSPEGSRLLRTRLPSVYSKLDFQVPHEIHSKSSCACMSTHVYVYVCVYTCVFTHHSSVFRSEDNWKEILSTCGSQGQNNQVLRFGRKHLYPLSHLASPILLSEAYISYFFAADSFLYMMSFSWTW